VRRREFITILGSAAAWPLAARAEQKARPMIGFFSSRSAAESMDIVAEFRRGLREAGFAEGENLVIEFRWAEGRYDRLPALAADLVRSNVNVIVAAGAPLQPSQPRRRRQRFQSSSPLSQTRSLLVLSPALAAPAAT
jgi:putative ABC transport system substrate-binding protein